MLKRLLIGIITFGYINTVFADNWVDADRIGSKSQGYTYARCYYETSSYSDYPNHRFSIVIEGSEYNCPYQIEYNPLTGKWRE
ncbi:Uncharacterised protein [Canicola haemoglobinophilus]|uniref:Uncharacterized protein n=1 Tax=Canicola haemoglobinophilus TaxID=733 RepID=A0AB38H8P6_9PAST|nr:hypothetical protein [Canicola haemoglobinophilus]STO55606.1 Uncharacterised protein [Canicola haemoglobinophilus]STO67932.1 Uncharacterised protein [Canicola haemoglobinophilus]